MTFFDKNLALNDNFDLTEIMSSIQKPLTEIMRLHELMTDNPEVNVRLKESSSVVLKNTQQIAGIVEAILQLERENVIEVILHNKLKFPHLYLVKSVFNSQSDEGAHNISTEKKIAAREDIKWLIKLEKLILELIDSSVLNLPHMASLMLMSERQLHRKVKRFTGKSPNKYIRDIKLEYAHMQLKNYTFKSLTHAAAAVGFKDSHYFSKLYKEKFGSDLLKV